MKNIEQIKLPPNPTIVITDSGLGGVSVMADLEKQISEKNIFNSVNLIFFNSHAAAGHGYNSMKSDEDKVRVFDSALQSMIDKFNPHIILVACNTLSVIADQTETSRTTGIPILGIVEFGIDLIYDNLMKDSNSSVIIYGTPTTIDSKAYERGLKARGIDDEKIVNQPCYLLETEIQRDSNSKSTSEMIDKYTDEAEAKLSITENKRFNVFAAFCCTHYGYSTGLFEESLSRRFVKSSVLNPNKLMSDFIISLGQAGNSETDLTAKVYSRVRIPTEEIESIGSLIKQESPLTFKALSYYELDENLFEFNPDLK